MRVAVNAQLASTQQNFRGAGVARYSLSLLASLGERDDIDLTAFVNRRSLAEPPEELAEIRTLPSALPLDRPLARVPWEQVALPYLAGPSRFDVIHGLVNAVPVLARTPSVVTVHDLVYRHYPETMRASRRYYQSAVCRISTRRASSVIAVSEQTARDLHDLLDVPASKIAVVPHGVDDRFRSTEQTGGATESTTSTPGVAGPFILYLGTIEPRKNLVTLVRAFHTLRSRGSGELDQWSLVIAGGYGWFSDELVGLIDELGLGHVVHLPGYVPDEDLPAWYRAADVFVYPSVHEGFGLPVLEAMASGTPVVCANTGAVAEVAGDAAITVDPTDESALANALASTLTNDDVRAELAGRGRRRSDGFTWEETARATVAVYESVAG